MTVRITWFGHSCIKVNANGYTIVFDPYKDGSVPGYPALHVKANQILCSHKHADHYGIENVNIIDTDKPCPWKIIPIHSYHDHEKGTKRGSNIIHILENKNLRIAHMGDIGCMPTKEQMEQLKNIDVMMVPVGGFYTMGVNEIKTLIDQLHPMAVIPIHYRMGKYGYDEIGTLEPFIQNEKRVQYVDTLECTDEKKTGIFVLKNHNA